MVCRCWETVRRCDGSQSGLLRRFAPRNDSGKGLDVRALTTTVIASEAKQSRFVIVTLW
jgi:hypothetical protein